MVRRIERGEVLGLAEYEPLRERFRARVMAEKKRRRIAVGPKVTVLFENRDSALLQIQEMLRTERISREAAILHEIETYNELVPGEDELSCTLMIEIPEKAERDAFLVAAAGLERSVTLRTGEARVPAQAVRHEEADAGRTTAVHYLKFPLPRALADGLRGAKGEASARSAWRLTVDHAAYRAEAELPADTLRALAEDLSDPA